MKFYDILYPTTYKVQFVRMLHGTPNIVKTKKVRDVKALMKFAKNKTVHIHLGKPALIDRNERIYIVNIKNNANLMLDGKSADLNPDDLDSCVSSKFLRDVIKGSLENTKAKIIFAVFGFLVGALLVFGIMSVVMQKKVEELLIKQIEEIPTILDGVKLCLMN